MIRVFLIIFGISFFLYASYIEDFQKMGFGIVPVRADKKIPTFTAKNLKGKTFTNKHIKGPGILVYWQIACPSCKATMIKLSELRKEVKKKKKKFQILSVTGDPAKNVAVYYAQNKIDLETIIDSNGEFQRAFGATVTPLLYIINKKSMVKGIIPGEPSATVKDLWKLVVYLNK